MNNWWLATLEYYGLLTREQAEHIAGEIKNTIHPERYIDAYTEIEMILKKRKSFDFTQIEKMHNTMVELATTLDDMEARVCLLEQTHEPPPEPSTTPSKSKKSVADT